MKSVTLVLKLEHKVNLKFMLYVNGEETLLFIYFLSYSIYLHVVTERKVSMLKQTFKSLQGPLGVPGPQFLGCLKLPIRPRAL